MSEQALDRKYCYNPFQDLMLYCYNLFQLKLSVVRGKCAVSSPAFTISPRFKYSYDVPHVTPIYMFKISLSLNLKDAKNSALPSLCCAASHTQSSTQGYHSPLSPGSFPCCVWRPPVCEPEL